ncbi:MAG: hypothetical protein KBD26_00850 [Candidatus Pacebacteria bacterium]|nr:hypothetical protein [Candidatus Paceibacterota bacterium]MBP9772359.1 hypothetical protein [Candidatus Paceibacterota bacterium]
MDIKKDISSNSHIENRNEGEIGSPVFSVENKAQNTKASSLLKRTQKIVTALYMVTECIEDGEPMKSSLRTSSLDLLKTIGLTDNKTAIKTNFEIESAEQIIRSLLSFLEISQIVGLIGTMNSSVLMRELTKLSSDLAMLRIQNNKSVFTIEGLKSLDLERADFLKNFTFGPSEEFKSEPTEISEENNLLKIFLNKSNGQGQSGPATNDFYKGHTNTKNIKDINTESKKDKQAGQSKKVDIAIKNERRNSILLALKNNNSVTVKDISLVVKNCSEKTLQRELTALVKDNILKKTGEKRWSKYSLI